MEKDLSRFLTPQSIAVVGASRTPSKTGAIVLRNIVDSGFSGRVFPVNPKADEIAGKVCYPNYALIPEVPELAVVVIPSHGVAQVLKEIADKGTHNVVIISSGYKETGTEGHELEKELIGISAKYGLNVLGPNCLGFVNNSLPINATFAQPVNQLGNLRYISQSGAIASSLFDWFKSTGLGFSEFVTLGNKAVLNENHFLEYFLDQSNSSHINQPGLSNLSPIGLYLESISNGSEFLRITSELTKKNPVFLIKPGKTAAAATAMQSHTGAIAGEDFILNAAMEEAGVIRCETLEEFFDLSRALSWDNLPQGPRVAIVSNAGGPAVISADAIESEGLVLAQFDDKTKKEFSEKLPRQAAITDPVDVLGDALADRYNDAIETVLKSNSADALVVILTPQVMTEVEKTAHAIGKLWEQYHIPIFCSFIGGQMVAEGERILNDYKIASFRFPERAISTIATMWRYKQHADHVSSATTMNDTSDQTINIDQNRIQKIISKAIADRQSILDAVQSAELLESAGIKTPPSRHITALDEAVEFANTNGWPVVLKLSSPGILHKKDIGGVITNIKNPDEMATNFHLLQRKIETLDEAQRAIVRIQIQKQVIDGVEVILGTRRDSNFGPVILFGAGGTLAELIDDRNIALFPINHSKAEQLVTRSKVYPILNGYRGEQPYALPKLYELIDRLGKLINAVPEADDIEINPLIVTPNEVWAVDGKVILKEGLKPKPMLPKFNSAICTHHEILATKFHYYSFETEEPLIFKPGQYVSVKVAENAIRAYSIAAQDDEHHFNLLVDTRPGGPGSQYFENMQVTHKMPYMGPFGVFTLNTNDNAKHLLMLATGSGISAIRCMVDNALGQFQMDIPVTMYFGLTYEEEIFWREHFESLKEKHKNFNYEIVLWKPTDTWHGASGFVTELVEKNFTDAHDIAAYLCGHQAMIESATKTLLANGCPADRIYKERFA